MSYMNNMCARLFTIRVRMSVGNADAKINLSIYNSPGLKDKNKFILARLTEPYHKVGNQKLDLI